MKSVSEYNTLFTNFVESGKNGYVPYGFGRSYASYNKPQNDRDDKNFIQWSWTSGGIGGGSCWDEGESNHYSVEGEPEPDFTPFDDFITESFPDISFVKYKRLLSKIKYESHYVNEYYGNSTTYVVKSITKQELLKTLQELGEVKG